MKKPMINENGYERIARAILSQEGQSTDTLTFTPGASIEEAVSTTYQHFLQVVDTQINMLGPGMDPATFVEIFATNYIKNGAMLQDLEDIAFDTEPVPEY